jgi:hypothetical protein
MYRSTGLNSSIDSALVTCPAEDQAYSSFRSERIASMVQAGGRIAICSIVMASKLPRVPAFVAPLEQFSWSAGVAAQATAAGSLERCVELAVTCP